MRPRSELIRFAKSHAQGMRNANTGNPDAVPVSVRGQAADGRYIVRRDHWPTDILVPSSPRDAAIPYPRRMPMGFEEGNAQLPVLYWVTPRGRTVLGPLGTTPPILTLNWVAHLADFARSSSWTSATIDISTPGDLAERTALTSSARAIRVEDLDPDPYAERGKHSGLFDTFYGTQALDDTDPVSGVNFTDLLDDLVADYDFVDYTRSSLCRVGGYTYLRFVSYYDPGSGSVPTLWIMKFHAASLSDDPLVPIWSREVAGYANLDLSELVVGDVMDDTDPENPVTVQRVFDLGWMESEGELVAVVLDAETGDWANVEEAPIEIVYESLDPPSSDMLGNRLAPYRTQVWGVGANVWLSLGGHIHGFELLVDGLGNMWDSFALGWTDATDSIYVGHAIITGVIGTRLMLAFDGVYTTEEIVDVPMLQGHSNFGEAYNEPRTEVARGLSRRGGILAVDGLTGTELGRSYWTDDPVEVDTLEGPRVDTYYAFAPYTWETQPRPEDANPDNALYSGLFELPIPRYYTYFWREGFDNIVGDLLSYDPTIEGTRDGVYGSAPGSLDDWRDGLLAEKAAKETADNAQFQLLQEARPTGAEYLRADRMIVSYPPIAYDGSSPPIDGWVATPTGTMTWDDIRGPFQPNVLDYNHNEWSHTTKPTAITDFQEYASPAFDGLTHNGISYSPESLWTWTVERQFIFFGISEESWPRYRSPAPPHAVGASCITSNSLMVCGPVSHEVEADDWLPLTWTAYRASGARAWSYTHTSGGGEDYCIAGNPIALEDMIVTFVRIVDSYYVIFLDLEGNLLEEIAAPSGLLGAIFNGTHLIGDQGKRFGLAL